MMLTRLRLGPRLAGAFAFLLALLACSSLFAIHRMSVQNDLLGRVAVSEVGALLAATRLESQTQAVGVALRDSILADKSEVVKASLATVDKLLGEMATTTTEIAGFTTPALAAQLDAVRQAQAPFLAAVKKVAGTMRSGDNDGARSELVSDATRKARHDYVAALGAFVQAQRALTDTGRLEAEAAFGRSRVVMLALALVAMAVGAVIAVAITRSIVGPARQATAAVRRIAQGDLGSEIAAHGRDEMAELLHGLHTMQDNLRSMVAGIRSGASAVSSASAEIAQGNLDLSTRTEQQSSNLQQTASAMEQMSATLRTSADSASQANQLAASACAVAERGGTVVAEVVQTMTAINESSRRISDIIGTIDGIAFQTNILALNAAVEAARAGEQGRGFAVVAGEVRSLAQRSAEAAREIKALIGNSVDKVESGARLVQDAGSTMEDIVGSVRRVSDIIAEITAATQEQSKGIQDVNGAVTSLDEMTQRNAALVEQSAAAASNLEQQARGLLDQVDAFRLQPVA